MKAIKFLQEKKLSFVEAPIIENPPSLKELKLMLGFLKTDGKDLIRLFNTSGELYRVLKISDKLKAGLSEEEALRLLSENGKLIKRPFLLVGKKDSFEAGRVGFDADSWTSLKFK
ncbi:MAG: arsenate reductase family protein [Bdellovibrionales bacterium]|nr:arsenate reductase family protein [Oligoflexia bacterium]